MKSFFYLLLYLFLVKNISCTTVKPSHFTPPAFDFQGHRGSRGLMPENTIPAMLKALEYNVTTLEMDVVVTKDKKIILSHEPWMNADITTTSNGGSIGKTEVFAYNIYKMNYDEVKKFDVGMKPHPFFSQQQKIAVHKPLLDDVITSVKNYIKANGLNKVQYNIETKSSKEGDNMFHPEPEEFIDLLLEVIKKNNIESKTIIQSFDERTLQYLYKVAPSIRTALLIEEEEMNDIELHLRNLGFQPDIYSPHYSHVTPDIIQYCHKKNILIIPWTVNDLNLMKKLKSMGVDGLISDYPNLFLQLK